MVSHSAFASSEHTSTSGFVHHSEKISLSSASLDVTLYMKAALTSYLWLCMADGDIPQGMVQEPNDHESALAVVVFFSSSINSIKQLDNIFISMSRGSASCPVYRPSGGQRRLVCLSEFSPPINPLRALLFTQSLWTACSLSRSYHHLHNSNASDVLPVIAAGIPSFVRSSCFPAKISGSSPRSAKVAHANSKLRCFPCSKSVCNRFAYSLISLTKSSGSEEMDASSRTFSRRGLPLLSTEPAGFCMPTPVNFVVIRLCYHPFHLTPLSSR